MLLEAVLIGQYLVKPAVSLSFVKLARYWKRIKESPSPILKGVLIANKQLQKEAKPSWLIGIGIMTEIFTANDMSPLANLGNLTSTTPKKLLDDEWHLNHKKYCEGKLRFYTSISIYHNMENPKFRQAITNFRISAHKFPIETGRYENKAQCYRICPLYCEGIGNKINYLNECNDSVITETRETLLKPFQTKWKGIDQITSEELCKAILGCQNHDMLNDIGNVCYSMQEVFKNKVRKAEKPHKNHYILKEFRLD